VTLTYNKTQRSSTLLNTTINTRRTVVSGTWKYDEHFQPRVVIFPYPTNDCVSYVLSYGKLQESWIISGLQWGNGNGYRLPCKNAHSPNYCSWLALCVNYSANFYCKIALINTFKLYLIKTYSKTTKKQTKRIKRRIYLTFAFSECHVVTRVTL